MIDVHTYYNSMDNNEVLFAYKGDFTTELLKSILKTTDLKMEELGEERIVRKRVNSILIECLQNMIYHSEKFESGKEDISSSILVISRTGEGFMIEHGNVVTPEVAEKLSKHIDKINSMTGEQLRDYYNEVLTNEEFSAKGGAGLGIIDIARKTKNNKVLYDFKPTSEEGLLFFSLFVQISPTSK
ncbi:MAG: SiaB family protein kinase [Bacteroidia bacterium]|nr:SiaB family protein kinase [Bacteroidia bacterium]